jgi:hypothetical protein
MRGRLGSMLWPVLAGLIAGWRRAETMLIMRVPPLLVLTLALQAIAFAQQPSVAELRFGWPRDLAARVDTERTRERQAETKTSTTIRASYRMTVSPHAEGLVIRYDDFNVAEGAPGDAAAAAEALSLLVPSLVVSEAGDFRRVEDLGPMKDMVGQLIAGLNQKTNTPAGLKALLAQLGSDQVLNNLAATEWQVLVSAWRGLPLTTEKFERATEETSPVLADVKIPMKVSGGMVERTECVRGGVRHDCGIFEIQSAVNQAAMEPIMRRLMEGVKGMQSVVYERLDVVTTARVRLETRTMVPHGLTTTRTVNMTALVPGEGRVNARQVERRTWTFRY